MTINIQAILSLIESGDDKAAVERFFGQVGPIAARACVEKMYGEAPTAYTGPGAQTALAQIAFKECRHFLRVGGDSYGVSDFPGVGPVADGIYDDGPARTQIHDWCNQATADFLSAVGDSGGASLPAAAATPIP